MLSFIERYRFNSYYYGHTTDMVQAADRIICCQWAVSEVGMQQPMITHNGHKPVFLDFIYAYTVCKVKVRWMEYSSLQQASLLRELMPLGS